ncbi:leukocyte elastase inhibitor-like isoform X2 [Hyperolius riggenbachi]|uniref:leukocyte elastase inhibitor-like isoform X2 n=1 Tax=Hyperolius riggenbachi TaxID=752182 RepID=UPI0035A276EB
MDALVTSFNEFSVKLFQNLSVNNGKNVMFSPMSIASAMTMVYVGAKGNTEVQMAEVLNFKKAAEEKSCMKKSPGAAHIQNISQVYEELFSNVFQPSKKYSMKSANRLYNDESFHTIEEYSQIIKKSFHAEIQAVDFKQSAEESRKKMNTWVEEQTEGKIKDLLTKSSIDSLTKLVLVNALYFKGNWEIKFPEENTEQKPFRLSKKKTKMVPMMFQRNKYNMFYIEEHETKVLELPYADKEISMVILLPDDIKDNSTGLERLKKALTYERLNKWTSADMMEKTEVEVELPRLRLEENYDLKSCLSKMGMTDLFNPDKAYLTGLSEESYLCVSHILHKVFVEINEEGTEAAAATAAVITKRSRPVVVKFHADHPFLFLIRHNNTKAILFYGAFCSP